MHGRGHPCKLERKEYIQHAQQSSALCNPRLLTSELFKHTGGSGCHHLNSLVRCVDTTVTVTPHVGSSQQRNLSALDAS